ncbi:hypothetical protein B7760_03695 [Burkholderia glumae]|nr:hypothetical protein KS03_4478 [Burkholderia glumae LMG 2196 = ATCC 33617]QKM49637.1 hypothetical protein B7760_03695 [Burkholderia glumae]QKM56295.1 hypothetical protein CG017_04359 [Burkholderia glumae]QTP36555.1 hypothetical protein B7759_05193 [Burkholderia glumae]
MTFCCFFATVKPVTQRNACRERAKKTPSSIQKNKSKQRLIEDYPFHCFWFRKKLFLYLRVATLGSTPKLTIPRTANHPGAPRKQ